MRKLDLVAGALIVVGGINWGLVSLAEFDLVATLVGEDFGETNAVSRIVYGAVGAAAIYAVSSFAARRRSPAAGRRPAAAHR